MYVYNLLKNATWLLRTRRRFYSGMVYLFLCCCIACEKFVAVDPPVTGVVSKEVFSSDQTAASAVAGLYSQMIGANLILSNGGMSVYAGLSADEIINTASNADLTPFATNNISATNNTGINTRMWNTGYKHIYHANAIIEGVSGSTGITEEVRHRLTGEAKLVRAFFYFYLVKKKIAL